MNTKNNKKDNKKNNQKKPKKVYISSQRQLMEEWAFDKNHKKLL